MPRFFIDKSAINGNSAVVTGDDARHIRKVLRMREGEALTLCDGCGTDYEAEITALSEDAVTAVIRSAHPNESEPEVQITLYQALPKSGKMEYIIQKCTELGICKIIPCIMERCVVKLNSPSDSAKKTKRYQSVAYAAAKQSQRGVIPVVDEPVAFAEAIEQMKGYDLSFVPYENEDGTTLKDVLSKTGGIKTAAFLIGPEGGISEQELATIRNTTFPTVTLGKRILRTETAGEAVLSMMNYELFL